jgi:hypothetical protein
LTASNICAAVAHVGASTPAGVASETGPLTSVTSGARLAARACDREPIFPELALVIMRTGSIGSSVGPAGDQPALADSAFGWKTDRSRRRISSASQHASHADFAARLVSRRRPGDEDAVVAQREHVSLRRRVLPASRRSSPGNHHGSAARARVSRADRREAMRDLGDEVGGRRRDHDQVAIARKLDVPPCFGNARIPQIAPRVWPVSACSVRRADEALGARWSAPRGHRTRPSSAARELGGLVGSDASRSILSRIRFPFSVIAMTGGALNGGGILAPHEDRRLAGNRAGRVSGFWPSGRRR